MRIIDVELLCYGPLLFGSILFMDEEYRGTGTISEYRDLETQKSFKILSEDSPKLTEDALYICGNDRAKDREVFHYTYASPEEALCMAQLICSILDTVNDANDDFVVANKKYN